MTNRTKIAKLQSLKNFIRNNIKFLVILAIVIYGISFITSPQTSVDSNFAKDTAVAEQLKSKINCENKNFTLEIIQNKEFLILKNYIKASKYFECHESITYTTQGEFTFLENTIPVVERWKAPVSVAVYSPGTDFMSTLNVIFYLRNCNAAMDLVKEYVTFHFFFDKMDSKDINNILTLYEGLESSLNCSHAKKFLNIRHNETYRAHNNLSYPINIARNLARTSATTHFVFASDIELYPNPNFVEKFLKMIADDKDGNWTKGIHVFPLPIFEIVPNVTIPDTKEDLVKLYNEQKVFLFHSHVCLECHMFPGFELWINDTDSTGMKVTSTTKRKDRFHHWEPLYVGTNNDPLYDERITYERRSDKMSQAYIMCILDYNFNVLSNGFLVHKNGIKTVGEANPPEAKEGKTFMTNVVLPEINSKYGKREGCRMY